MKKVLLPLLLLPSLLAFSQMQRLLIGTYTNTNSTGIYQYDFNSGTGKADLVDSMKTTNPSFLATARHGKFIYSVNEEGKAQGSGKVSAFAVSASGHLSLLNQQSSGGEHPCYIAVDKTEHWIAVGNYTTGTVSVLQIKEDGSLGEAATTIQHRGSSVNKARQSSPHVHATVFSPDNKYLLVSDLGTDKLMVYSFNVKTGNLLPLNAFSFAKLPDGTGPRHLAFHPNSKWVYLVGELTGTVTLMDYKKGVLQPSHQTISLLPKDYKGAATAADIHVSADGRFLYASNRNTSNNIAIFSINQKSGILKPIGHQSTLGRAPRNFNFDPSGNFLLVANQDTDNVVVFRVNRQTGLLTDTGHRIAVPRPVCVQWLVK
ncbi:MAG: hypothetical protein JWP88_362 [Flaviaesturariibacter sp.]|nr:hypothetical protein [Flaviaesturariibacter sp.]